MRKDVYSVEIENRKDFFFSEYLIYLWQPTRITSKQAFIIQPVKGITAIQQSSLTPLFYLSLQKNQLLILFG